LHKFTSAGFLAIDHNSPAGHAEAVMVKGLARYANCLRHGLLAKCVDVNLFIARGA
jgi:hypothetical protein